MKITFVVLHYNTFEMTCCSVNCLLSTFKNEDIQVVIVDNASINDSGKGLCKYFGAYPNVHVILSKENLGFAKGNNLGYRYAVEKLHAEFIVVQNNDVLVTDHRFIEKFVELYRKTDYAVLGPDIYSPHANLHQNPAYGDSGKLYGMSVDEVRRQKKRLRIKLLLWPISECIRRFKSYCRKVFFQREVTSQEDYKSTHEDVVLHGACYIFSPLYIKKMSFAFDPRTFMFMEEDILHLKCKRAHLKILYDPSLFVIHLEDVSTNSVLSGTLSKIKWKNEEVMKSMSVFLDELQKDGICAKEH